MKGAKTVPCVKTINPPKINKTIKIGNNQIFFLVSKNFKNSFKNNIKIDYPLNF